VEFAPLAGMTPVTLRAIESGLRPLNSGDESRIAGMLGAIWREDGWYCVSDPEKPYDAAFFEFYTGAFIPGFDKLAPDSEAIPYVLSILERSLPADRYRATLLNIHRLILDTARASSISPEEIRLIELRQPLRPREVRHRKRS
jgi:hypothetical protein